MKKFQTLGELLSDFRAFSNISQSDLASELDVDVRSVIRWEKNDTLLSNEKEHLLSMVTFIPYQVIRNLNASVPIATFYDFDLRKYSLSSLSKDLPDADWIKSRLTSETDRIKTIDSNSDIEHIIRFIELQRNPLKTINKEIIRSAAQIFPEMNLIIQDQSGNYSGHCVYFPLHQDTYQKLRNREMTEAELEPKDLIDHKNNDNPVFYCHSITADCNENFFYIIGEVLNFYRKLDSKDYLYALITSRYDSHLMSHQLGVHTVWEDRDIQEQHNLLGVPRLVEGNFKNFLKKINS
ncbi:MAG: helix-turn-helix transcriptional regulator [Psychroserpens sp.]|nr:helix-turn-helix transcriptional regulator [Psychroserpens sp.]